jgi:phosphonate transport system permease protein
VLAGILAIALRSIGFIGKLLYEAIEEIDSAQVEAIEATGASGAQTMAWGVVPQVAPTLAGITVFRWDINIRESTVLGLVGAGGIGVKLEAALGTLAWPKVTTLLHLDPGHRGGQRVGDGEGAAAADLRACAMRTGLPDPRKLRAPAR